MAKSLAAGIKDVQGSFNKGDHIKILTNSMTEFARGLSKAVSPSDEILKLKEKVT